MSTTLTGLPGEVDVVVVGAGISGLACAAHLSKAVPEASVLVLEASERIGGRARVAEVGGFSVDIGAGWIHGIEGNPLLEDGVLEPADLLECSAHNIWVKGPASTDSSNFHPAAEDLERWCTWLEKAGDAESLADAFAGISNGCDWTDSQWRMLRALELWFGAPVEELCAVEWQPDSSLGDFPGAHAVVKGGMPTVATRLFEALGRSCCVALNVTVERIEEEGCSTDDEHAVTLSVTAPGEVGSQVRARWLVCTIPLGVLQGKSAVPPPSITPTLPASLLQAIGRLRMSPYCKCVLALAEDAVASYPTWTWTDDSLFPMAFSYWKVKKMPLVACTSVSRQVAAMDDEEVVATARAAIGVTKAAVLDSFITRWHEDRFSAGSYSFSPVGCDFTEVDTFQSAMEGRRIIFAGEHTHDEHQGAVHGAYLSGVDAAKQMLTRGLGAKI